MSAFTLDIRGQLNSLHLADAKALWPLFEAVVNSIQSIEESPNKDCGKITIFAQREATGQTGMEHLDILERFESFSITDNGLGLNIANYDSFNTAYSTHKVAKGCKTLKSMPVIDSNSTKEPDIAVFDMAFAYSDSDEPLSTVTIVEFKKPDNDSKNPLNQVGEYIDQIRAGKKKKATGQSFSVTSGTLFRCYVICDLTDRMRTHCRNSGLLPTADNLGYTGFHQARNATYEVISYNKLLADAKKRNQILFDKLFAPKPSGVIHIPKEEEGSKPDFPQTSSHG